MMTPDAPPRCPSFDHVRFAGDAPNPTCNRAPRPLPARAFPERRPTLPPDPAADDFVQWVLRRARIDPRPYRTDPLHRRLPACLRLLRAQSFDGAKTAIEQHPKRLGAALGTLLIGVTSFFRDWDVFDHLRHDVLPDVLKRTDRPRVWSAACSAGHELYSVAMLLADVDRLPGATLVGTDCRADALARAAAAAFPDADLARLPECFRLRHVRPSPTGPHLCDALRHALRWLHQDVLLAAPPPGRFDLILCRNLAIYLHADAAEDLWHRLARHLAPGGYLVVGKAEKVRLPGLVRTGPCTYRHTGVAPV
jgi:chemotaxis methyl-accepting protein methylase